MASNTESIVQDFIDRKPNRKGEIARNIKRVPVWYEGNTIYSYGLHFPMGVLLFDKRNKIWAALVQTEKYGSTTGRHMGILRSALTKNGIKQIPTRIEPYQSRYGW